MCVCVCIYLFIIIIILHNSSILDIEHSPYYIARDLVTINTLII